MEGKKIIKGGLFITFEGAEGSGKSTQIRFVREFFEEMGYDVTLTREPGGTPISEKIRKLLLDPANKSMLPVTELLLYAASRTQHLGEVIVPNLEKGGIVICDRFHDSTTAYQGYGRGIDTDLIQRIHDISLAGRKPDITFVLKVDVKLGLDRARKISDKGGSTTGGDRLEKEHISFHERVVKGYECIARNEPKRVVLVEQGTIEEIRESIIATLKARIEADANHNG